VMSARVWVRMGRAAEHSRWVFGFWTVRFRAGLFGSRV
jgi:hypothetical protein